MPASCPKEVRVRRILLVTSVAALLAALLPAAVASAAPRGTAVFAGTASTPKGRLAVKVDVKRFRATKQGTVAEGVATATLRGLNAAPTTVRKKVTLSQARGGRCTILTLVLDELDLTLLGLNVHLDKVDLRVTGRRRGGVLGRLFCSLSGARVRTARVSAVSKINREIRKTGTLRPMAFSVPVSAVTAQAPAPTCNVLDLVLGPLHVNLLGLIVDLNRVHLTITANPAGGILGSLFCGLANTPV
jgi:hypothetical protein